jgi:hypothetical protein
MNEDTQKVVKCASCESYFGYAESNKNCPFCRTAYDETAEEPKEPKMRKVPVGTQEDSFRILKDR